MKPRAVVFDLDETLYRERRFAISGYAAVAREIERAHGVPPRETFRVMARALRSGRRREAFQDVVSRFGLPAGSVGLWLAIYRTHRPLLRLPPQSRAVLTALRPSWKLGIVTNGLPTVQASKARALGLAGLVDRIVYAEEYGNGRGKPDADAFLAIADDLGVETARTVFVGDDPACDVAGARGVGMHTILVAGRRPASALDRDVADVTAGSLADVVPLAERLVPGGSER